MSDQLLSIIKFLILQYSGLLEDFKEKSYTVKEMEILFENWRRKVEVPEAQNKNSKDNNKPASSLLRMFKPKVNSF